MIGRAEAMGAISVVNAIACGKGATVSVKLPTSAKLELREQRGSWHVSLNGRKTESTLVVQTVRHAIRKLGRDPSRYSGSIQTATSAPIGVGLKTPVPEPLNMSYVCPITDTCAFGSPESWRISEMVWDTYWYVSRKFQSRAW